MKVFVTLLALALVLPALATADTIYVNEYWGTSTGIGFNTNNYINGSVVAYSSTTDAITAVYPFSHAWTSTLDSAGNLWLINVGSLGKPTPSTLLGEIPSGTPSGTPATIVATGIMNNTVWEPEKISMTSGPNPTIYVGTSQSVDGLIALTTTGAYAATQFYNVTGQILNSADIEGTVVDKYNNVYGAMTLPNGPYPATGLLEMPSNYVYPASATMIATNHAITNPTPVGTPATANIVFPGTTDVVLVNPEGMAFDKNGNLWVCNQQPYYQNEGNGNFGISEYSGSGANWTYDGYFTVDQNIINGESYNEDQITDIQFDSAGGLWILSQGGVYGTLYDLGVPVIGGGDVTTPIAEIDLPNADAWHFTIGPTEQIVQPSVPEPISMVFFGTGLVAVSGYIARKRMQRKA